MRMTYADWVYFAKLIIVAFVYFYLKCLVLGIYAVRLMETGPCPSVEKAKEVAADHTWGSLGLHIHRIHRGVFNSTVKLTHYAAL